MYARVARFEGADAESLRGTADAIRAEVEAGSGPPEGVPAHGFLLLQVPEEGKTLAIALFESEEDYAKGDEALSAMSPPGEGMGNRAAVEKYEVAIKVDL